MSKYNTNAITNFLAKKLAVNDRIINIKHKKCDLCCSIEPTYEQYDVCIECLETAMVTLGMFMFIIHRDYKDTDEILDIYPELTYEEKQFLNFLILEFQKLDT